MAMDGAKLMEHTKSLQRAHQLQRYQLELALDAIPRDSRYSSHLVDLMKREDLILRDGNMLTNNSTASSIADIGNRVDEALRNETRQFFRSVSQHNVKKWIALLQKFDKERGNIRGHVDHGRTSRLGGDSAMRDTAELTAATSCLNLASEGGGKPKRFTVDMIDREIDRLEANYNENWVNFEKFSMEEAFRSQLARIDNDWSGHEQTLNNEYGAKCKELGVTPNFLNVTQVEKVDTTRWQPAEKQKTLIHTAPVHAPDLHQRPHTSAGSLAGSHSSLRGRNHALEAEVERTENNYRAAAGNLAKQKQVAKNWMKRQGVRLYSQMDEIFAERKAILALMRREETEFELLKDLITQKFKN